MDRLSSFLTPDNASLRDATAYGALGTERAFTVTFRLGVTNFSSTEGVTIRATEPLTLGEMRENAQRLIATILPTINFAEERFDVLIMYRRETVFFAGLLEDYHRQVVKNPKLDFLNLL